MNKLIKLVIPVFIFMILALPLLSFAQTITPPTSATRSETNGLVTCGNANQPECDFSGFMSEINLLIGYSLFYLAIPIGAIMMAYAGVLLVTSGGAEGKTKAKSIFTNAVIGLACSAGAYLVIKLILNILGYQGAWIGF